MQGWSKVVLIFFLGPVLGYAQDNRYMVFFKDKQSTPHQISAPFTFLSARAIDRRNRSGVEVNSDDLPVPPAYLTQLRSAGAKVFFTTRWMNGALVEASAAEALTIQALPIVTNVELVAPGNQLLGGRRRTTGESANAGSASTDLQLSQLGIDQMHAAGYRGEGVYVAVMDTGFPGVDVVNAFQSLRDEGRIILTKDFVQNSGSVYQYNPHGTEVLSVMTAKLTGTDAFNGAAPGASYLLFCTEDANSEYRIEEYNWLFAAEMADSAGVDVIQTSLGYTTFDDTSMDYTVDDLNGTTAVISRAAGFARDRGLVVVVSAGNEGQSPWKKISPPADVAGVLSVAAVNSIGLRASFSSYGPSSDGRIKPDVAALGFQTSVVLSDGNTGTTSGTSLASPLIASLMAGLVQAFPDLPPGRLLDAVRLTATQSASPDNSLGYGIPSFVQARQFLEQTESIQVFPNPAEDQLTVYIRQTAQTARLEIININGQRVALWEMADQQAGKALTLDVSQLAKGIYLLKAGLNGTTTTVRFFKL